MTLRGRFDSVRNRVAQRLANAALRLASPWYRNMIGGSIQYGLRAAARDADMGTSAPGPWYPVPHITDVMDSRCECENEQRNSYRWRGDGLWHCEQCDGLMPDQDQLHQTRADA